MFMMTLMVFAIVLAEVSEIHFDNSAFLLVALIGTTVVTPIVTAWVTIWKMRNEMHGEADAIREQNNNLAEVHKVQAQKAREVIAEKSEEGVRKVAEVATDIKKLVNGEREAMLKEIVELKAKLLAKETSG